MTGVLNWSDRFELRDLRSWPVVFTTVLLTAPAPLYGLGLHAQTPVLIVVSVSAGVSLVMLSLLSLATFAVERLSPHASWTLGVVTVVLLAFARALAIGALVERFGWDEAALVPRVLVTTPLVALTILFTAQVTHLFRSYARQRHDALARRAELARARDAIRLAEPGPEDSLVQDIRQRLREAIPEVIDPGAEAVLTQLHHAIEEVIRPLSHTLSIPERAAPGPDRRRSWLHVAAEWMDVRNVQPGMLFAILIIVLIPIGLNNGLPNIFVTVPVGAGILCGLLWLGKRLCLIGPRWLRRWGGPLITVLASLVVIPLTTFGSRPDVMIRFLIGVFFFLAVITSALGLGLRWSRTEARELERENELMRWQLARAAEELRQRRAAISQALHGQVQAKLAAAYFRLQRAVHTGGNVESAVRGAEEALAGVPTFAFEPANDARPVAQTFSLLTDTWKDVAEITIRHPEAVFPKIDQDPTSRKALVDVLAEVCFNAIKHGGATSISVTVVWPSDAVMELTVTNNGSLTESNRRGLGSDLLDGSSIRWKRESTADGTRVHVELPWHPVEPAHQGSA